MKQLKNHILKFFILASIICLTHCASSPETQGDYSSILKFYSGGSEYTIMSYLSNNATGYNILMREENDNVIIKSIDKQQDGELDEVLEGDFSLADANKIYADGLAAAKEMGMLKERNFDFISLDDMLVRLDENRKKKFIVLTFDDGYAECYSIVAPLLKKYNISCIFFIITDTDFIKIFSHCQ